MTRMWSDDIVVYIVMHDLFQFHTVANIDGFKIVVICVFFLVC